MNTTIKHIQALQQNINHIIKGKKDTIDLVITCLIAGGHILIEDNPGTGKTMLAKTLAKSISTDNNNSIPTFKRIQFTPDLLPMDLIGAYIFDDRNNDFIFKKGPLFTHILLADEINRASPKVQSALLECMAEQQVTVGDTTYPLSDTFFAIATQNPIEMEGTYPLPAAQLDRFAMKISFGYIDFEDEFALFQSYITNKQNHDTLQPVISLSDIKQLQCDAEKVLIADNILLALTHIIHQTRQHPDITLGASTRAGIMLIKCLKAFALIQQRNYVTEDDLKYITPFVLTHRISSKKSIDIPDILKQIISSQIEKLHQLKIN